MGQTTAIKIQFVNQGVTNGTERVPEVPRNEVLWLLQSGGAHMKHERNLAKLTNAAPGKQVLAKEAHSGGHIFVQTQVHSISHSLTGIAFSNPS